ncbi:MAG TPA: hypothetical protein VFE05_06570 [Longimicrobiaceae bacterium]|jgi:hypothetical protein|nr:hypothetical protein [Longimicrobiaceae bacterium]
MRRILIAPCLLALAACKPGDSRQAAAGSGTGADSAGTGARVAWSYNPHAQVTLTGGDPLTVETGPAVIVWPAGAKPLAPPYTVRARLQKHTGRLHEGTGLLFGGADLDKPENQQSYSYFLTRGDGSFLIKLRKGAEIPIVQDWTAHPSVRRDTEEGGRANDLMVQVTAQDVAFFINGTQVARLPAAQFQTRGVAGLRVSHELQLEVTGFQASPGIHPPDVRP